MEVSWLSNRLLSRIISKATKVPENNIEIISSNISNACGDNEHFVSSLVRVQISYNVDKKSYTASYLIKLIDEQSRFKNFVDLHELFEREAYMYESILPAIENIWELVGEKVEFAPRLVFLSKQLLYN